MSNQAWIPDAEHPMILAALGRLGSQGGWARILDGKPLEDPTDQKDADLLLAVGVLRTSAEGRLEPAHVHPWLFDPEALSGGVVAALRSALRHAEGHDPEWSADDLGLVRAQSRASLSAGTVVAESVLPLLESSYAAFAEGAGHFLDVGVGAGALIRTVCASYPTATAVGIDVLPAVLEIAERDLDARGLGERVELRLQSVAELADQSCFDLAWMPQAFLPRADLEAGLRTVHAALRPDRWLIAAIAASPRDAEPVQRHLAEHGARLAGGGAITVARMTELLETAGYADVRALDLSGQVLMVARRP